MVKEPNEEAGLPDLDDYNLDSTRNRSQAVSGTDDTDMHSDKKPPETPVSEPAGIYELFDEPFEGFESLAKGKIEESESTEFSEEFSKNFDDMFNAIDTKESNPLFSDDGIPQGSKTASESHAEPVIQSAPMSIEDIANNLLKSVQENFPEAAEAYEKSNNETNASKAPLEENELPEVAEETTEEKINSPVINDLESVDEDDAFSSELDEEEDEGGFNYGDLSDEDRDLLKEFDLDGEIDLEDEEEIVEEYNPDNNFLFDGFEEDDDEDSIDEEADGAFGFEEVMSSEDVSNFTPSWGEDTEPKFVDDSEDDAFSPIEEIEEDPFADLTVSDATKKASEYVPSWGDDESGKFREDDEEFIPEEPEVDEIDMWTTLSNKSENSDSEEEIDSSEDDDFDPNKSKNPPKEKKQKNNDEGKENSSFKLPSFLAIPWKFITGVSESMFKILEAGIKFLAAVPIIGIPFRLIKVVLGAIPRKLKMWFLPIVFIFFALGGPSDMIPAPSVTSEYPDSGEVKFSEIKQLDNGEIIGKLENTGEVGLTVNPSVGFKSRTWWNPVSWFNPEELKGCAGPETPLDIGATKEIKFSCGTNAKSMMIETYGILN